MIRASIDEFQPSKSQKQDLRKFNRFLKGQFDGSKKEKADVQMEEKTAVKKPVLEDEKAQKVLDVLNAVEKVFEI